MILLTLPPLNIRLQEAVLVEREREQSAVRSGMSVELERVRGELEETQRQCQLLREASEKVHFFLEVYIYVQYNSHLEHPLYANA